MVLLVGTGREKEKEPCLHVYCLSLLFFRPWANKGKEERLKFSRKITDYREYSSQVFTELQEKNPAEKSLYILRADVGKFMRKNVKKKQNRDLFNDMISRMFKG